MRKLLFYSILILLVACNKDDGITDDTTFQEENGECPTPTGNSSYLYNQDGELWLRGGLNPGEDFNISNWQLDVHYLRYGLGRETFKALVEPEFVSKEDYPRKIELDETVILVHGGIGGAKVYTKRVMDVHEVVNDEINGVPIAVTYCPSAKFYGVYLREHCETTLTFGVSGYTYFQCDIWDSKDGFILWDRNTESLWWPLIGKGVSGTLNDEPMKPFNSANWEVTTYGKVLEIFSDFVILKPNQTVDLNGEWANNLEEPDC